jgi:hypothetical protein
MKRYFWLEKDSPLKEKMIFSMDYYSFSQKWAWSVVGMFVVIAVVMAALSAVYGR